MRSFMGRDILSLKDFERNEFFHVFEVAKELEPIAKSRRNSDLLREKTLVTAFYQPSTRTRLAHEAAMHRLGGHVTGFSDAKMTRAGDFYQESIKDTVKMLEFYGDVIVMRPARRSTRSREMGLCADHQRRRWLGGASNSNIDRPLHRFAGKRAHRWPELAGCRGYAHAHDALARLRVEPI